MSIVRTNKPGTPNWNKKLRNGEVQLDCYFGELTIQTADGKHYPYGPEVQVTAKKGEGRRPPQCAYLNMEQLDTLIDLLIGVRGDLLKKMNP
mgnify:FL=1